jgi:glycerophosphoryl diester phosphodiesterase
VTPLRRRFPDLLVAYESIDLDRARVEAHAGSPDSGRLIVSVQHFAARAPEALRRARELGLRTSSFTPNRFDDLERALAAKIDFIQTDRPDRALWLRARQAQEPVEAPADAAPGARR